MAGVGVEGLKMAGIEDGGVKGWQGLGCRG